MADEPMTLIERLLNPQWVHGPSPFDDALLDKWQTVKDMREAADEIRRLKFKKRPVAWRVKNGDGNWLIFDDEERAYRASEEADTEMQGLFVRDGT